jgi:hypothetical protein
MAIFFYFYVYFDRSPQEKNPRALCQEKILLFLYVPAFPYTWRFPYSWVLPRFRNTLKLMPKRTHSQGNLPYNFIDQTYFSSKFSSHFTWFHDHE